MVDALWLIALGGLLVGLCRLERRIAAVQEVFAMFVRLLEEDTRREEKQSPWD